MPRPPKSTIAFSIRFHYNVPYTNKNIFSNPQFKSDRPINNTPSIRLFYRNSNLLRIRSAQQSNRFHSHCISEIFWIALMEIKNLKYNKLLQLILNRGVKDGSGEGVLHLI